MPMNIKTINTYLINNQAEGNIFGENDNGSSPIVYFGYSKDKLGELTRPRLVYVDDEKIKWEIDESRITPTDTSTSELFTQQPNAGVSVKQGARRAKRKAE